MEELNETARKIIECAAEVFAEKGYQAASVSDICGKAGVNRASINYYFRSKDNLFKESFRYAISLVHGGEETAHGYAGRSPRERLRVYISALIQSIFDNGPAGWFMRIMFHEIVSPTIFAKDFIAEVLTQERQTLDNIIHDLTGETDKTKLHMMNMSVMSQCLFFNMTRNIRKHKMELKIPPFDRPDFRPDEHLERVIDHVYNFCIRGLVCSGNRNGELNIE